MVVVWSAGSFALQGAPEGVPRRVSTQNTWEVSSSVFLTRFRNDALPVVSILIVGLQEGMVSTNLSKTEAKGQTRLHDDGMLNRGTPFSGMCECLQVKETWYVTQHMAQVPGTLIAAALIPATIIAILFFFDHSGKCKATTQKLPV